MIKVALALVVVANMGPACKQSSMTADTRSSSASMATALKAAVATGPAEGTVSLRLVASLQKGNPHDANKITALAESLDGKLLAWGDYKGSVRLHSFKSNETSTIRDRSTVDISTRRELHIIEDLAFDEKGLLWWVDHRRNVYCTELKDLQIKKTAVAARITVVTSNLLPWAVLSTDITLAWPPKEYLKLFEVGTGKVHESDVVFPRQRGVNEMVHDAVRSPDGKLLMAVADGDAALLSLPDLKIVRRFGQGWGESAAFSPSSKLVALGTDGRGVFVWRTETGKLVKQIPFRRATRITSLVFAGEDILYAADYPLYRIDVRKGTQTSVAKVNAQVVLLSKSGHRLFVGSYEGGVDVFQLPPTDVPQKDPTSRPTSRGVR